MALNNKPPTPVTEEELAEQKEYERVISIRRLDEAHDMLDFLYLPRKVQGQVLTVGGRVNWMRDHFPVEFSALADVIEKARNEQSDLTA